MIFVITPTYSRSNQQPDLVRLCTVFSLAGDIHWIVVEDAKSKSQELARFLKACGLPYTHLNHPTAANVTGVRGSGQRNAALKWLRQTYQPYQTSGVVYFADDDNTYHPQIFTEMRYIKRGGTWPVGLIADSDWEGCITSPSDRSKILDFWAKWRPTRKFPIDMAAFAVHLDVVLNHPKALFNDHSSGIQEGIILAGLGFNNAFDLEPRADGCTKLLVWHTKSNVAAIKFPGPKTIDGMF
ncbi:hypothetical protein Aperf_G00000103083 [Anoplocephala perfoliata]